jgi:hypothetical protein
MCGVLSGRGLCDGLIPRPEESYRRPVSLCVLSRNVKNEAALVRVGLLRQRKSVSFLRCVLLVPPVVSSIT